jgi:hypothetical protein
VYVRDSGITHSLLNIESYNDLPGHPVAGGSWEGFVIKNILSVAPSRVQPFYYGTPAGAELTWYSNFEAKKNGLQRSSAVRRRFYLKAFTLPVRMLHRNDAMLFTGKDTFSLGDGVTAISLYQLMQEVLEE